MGALRFATLASCCFACALSEGACRFALDRVVGAVGAASYITCTPCRVSRRSSMSRQTKNITHTAARPVGTGQPQWSTPRAWQTEQVHVQGQLSSQVGCLQLGTLGLEACCLLGGSSFPMLLYARSEGNSASCKTPPAWDPSRQAQPEQLPTCWEHSIMARLLGSGRRWAAVEAAPGAVRLPLWEPSSSAPRSAG